LLVLGGTTWPPFRTVMKVSCLPGLASAACGVSTAPARAATRTEERRIRLIMTSISLRSRREGDEPVVHVPRQRAQVVGLRWVEHAHLGSLVDDIRELVELVLGFPDLARRVAATGRDRAERRIDDVEHLEEAILHAPSGRGGRAHLAERLRERRHAALHREHAGHRNVLAGTTHAAVAPPLVVIVAR